MPAAASNTPGDADAVAAGPILVKPAPAAAANGDVPTAAKKKSKNKKKRKAAAATAEDARNANNAPAAGGKNQAADAGKNNDPAPTLSKKKMSRQLKNLIKDKDKMIDRQNLPIDEKTKLLSNKLVSEVAPYQRG